MEFFQVGMIVMMLIINIVHGSILSNGTAVKTKEKPEFKHQTDTQLGLQGGGTRIISDLEIYPGGKAGVPGPPGPPGPAGPPGPEGTRGGGVTFIRWGRTSCPDTEKTEVLYKGKAVGPYYTQRGGGSNYMCLTDNPVPLPYTAGRQSSRSYVYGTEYEIFKNRLNDHNVPCVVCYTPVRSVMVMIPGTANCTSSWTREYNGYIVAELDGHVSQMRYECVDANAEGISGSAANTNGALFYYAEATCVGISCPPYQNGMELSCAVCTK